MAVLEIDGITKIYKGKGRTITATQDVSFNVDKGEIVGFIGHNGAGKSTTLKIAVGLAEATTGTVRINGYDIRHNRVKALEKVGCIVESPDLYREWSALKNLEYLASFGNNPEFEGVDKRAKIKARAEELLKMVGLYERRNDPIRKYSLGMKQRTGIAQALICKPDLLILDEPTNGLDPAGIKEVRDILQKLSKEYGMAILISSHLLAEIEMFCDRYVIIDKGKIIGSFTKKDMETDYQQELTQQEIILVTDDVVKAKDVLNKVMLMDCEVLGNGKVKIITEKSINDVAKELILAGVSVLGISGKGTSLEEFFMKVTGRGGDR